MGWIVGFGVDADQNHHPVTGILEGVGYARWDRKAPRLPSGNRDVVIDAVFPQSRQCRPGHDGDFSAHHMFVISADKTRQRQYDV